jgi:hypothetical protein
MIPDFEGVCRICGVGIELCRRDDPAASMPRAGAAPGTSPDAEIVAWCDETMALDAAVEVETAALDREGAYLGDPTPEQGVARAAVEAKARRAREIVAVLCTVPSATLAGVRAKAGVVVAINGGCTGAASCEATPELARVVCDELLRIAA